MKIALLEPFYTGSHKAWAEGYQAFSRHQVEIFSLSGHHWKWRMHGGALSLARQFLQRGFQPDLILATDMLDLTSFLAATRRKTASIPTAIYFHENQLTYPRQEGDPDILLQRDLNYSFINFASAAVADSVLFNSQFHQEAFLQALPKFLKRFPDERCLDRVKAIEEKSEVLPIGLNLPLLSDELNLQKMASGSPILVWNHRWEYDKGPELFFESLFFLQDRGYEFRLIVLGESYAQQPAIFQQAKNRLSSHLLHWGYAKDRDAYFHLLSQGDLLPVTAIQDFFGISMVEGLHAGLIPLVPKTGVYKEHIPTNYHSQLLYSDSLEFQQKLISFLKNPNRFDRISTSNWATSYSWEHMAPRYDAALENINPL